MEGNSSWVKIFMAKRMVIKGSIFPLISWLDRGLKDYGMVMGMLSHVQLLAADHVAHQAPLSVEFPRQGGLPFPTPGDLPDLGIEPARLHWQVGSFYHWATWQAQLHQELDPISPDPIVHALCTIHAWGWTDNISWSSRVLLSSHPLPCDGFAS